MQTIVIEIRGGCLWAVRTLDNPDPQLDVILRDHDNIDAGDPDPLEDIDPQRLTSIY